MSDEQSKPNIYIGGNVSGGNVNIGGTQTIHGNLSIKMGALPAAGEDVREELKKQIAALMAELEKQPAEQTRDVKEVKMAVEDAVGEADKAEPDKERLQIRGDKLMEAAKNLAQVTPIIGLIAGQIAQILLRIG